MKLHSLRIENFRAIKDSGKLSFIDDFSKPRPVTLIVGPNGCGKTSILDAIQIVVRSAENPRHPQLREGLEFSAQQLVYSDSRVKRLATITFKFSLEETEAQARNQIAQDLNLKCISNSTPTIATWKFPNPNQTENKFNIEYTEGKSILGARGELKRAVDRNIASKSNFDQIGGVCYLDQRRSLMLIKNFSMKKEDRLPYNDVLSWLAYCYRKHLTWNTEKSGESYWSRVQRLFNTVCYPTKLVGLESDDEKDTLILSKDGVEYDLSQMSSGEHQVLRILVGLVSEKAKNSIVLIDEIELHLHPAWQIKLLQLFRDDVENNNQYIITTHSPYVKKLFYEDEIIDLGDLGA